MDDDIKETFITMSNGGTPQKNSNSGHLLIGDSINGMNITTRYKAGKKRAKPRTKRLLNIGDTMVTLLVLAPLVVAHWRGTWSFMDHREEYFPPWTCFILGAVLHTVFALLRQFLHLEFSHSDHKTKSWGRTLVRHVVSKFYTYVFSMACILHWRGGWGVLTIYFEEELWNYVIITVATLIPLIALRSVRNTIAVPYVVITDYKDCTFAFPTRFRTLGSREPGLYILDCLFSVIVVGSLVVFVWRGVWVFLDIVIYPDNKTLSSYSSLIIGYGIVAVTFALQPAMRWTCERLNGLWRLATADLFLFFSFLGTINVWRGVWGLLDVYFIPENPLMSDLLTHGVSIVLLTLLNCANTVLVRGVYIDAEEPDGQCVIFPVYYIRLFFQKERLKKQKRLMDMEKGGTAGGGGGGGGISGHCQHQGSMRQQLLRHNEKCAMIVPMNKLASSHLNLSHHPPMNLTHCSQTQMNSNCNNRSGVNAAAAAVVAVSLPEEKWRIIVNESALDDLEERGDRRGSDDGGGGKGGVEEALLTAINGESIESEDTGKTHK